MDLLLTQSYYTSSEDLEYSVHSHKDHFSGLFFVCKNSSAFHRTIPLKSDFLFLCCCIWCVLHIGLFVCVSVSEGAGMSRVQSSHPRGACVWRGFCLLQIWTLMFWRACIPWAASETVSSSPETCSVKSESEHLCVCSRHFSLSFRKELSLLSCDVRNAASGSNSFHLRIRSHYSILVSTIYSY